VASLLFTLVASLVLLPRAVAPNTAGAQTDDQAAHARLLAEYQAAPSLSTGCSLAEVERRLGRLDDAAARLDALLRAVDQAGYDEAQLATHSACLFNRARVYEERGELNHAYTFLGRALNTPHQARRRVVEQRLVQVAGRLVQSSGCGALTSRLSPQGLLRFGDNAALRRCVQSVQRSQPFCARMAAADIPAPDAVSRYLTRRLDDDTVAIVDEGFLMVVTRRGARASAIECRLPNSDETIGSANWVTIGRQRLLSVVTNTTVSYACDECEDDGGDCRCEDVSSSLYMLNPRGDLVLALVDTFDDGGMAAWGADAPELREATRPTTTVEGDILVMGGRRLRFVRGALVPAP